MALFARDFHTIRRIFVYGLLVSRFHLGFTCEIRGLIQQLDHFVVDRIRYLTRSDRKSHQFHKEQYQRELWCVNFLSEISSVASPWSVIRDIHRTTPRRCRAHHVMGTHRMGDALP
jgi:hypothetical protein